MNSNNLINIGVVILAVTLGYLFYQWTHKPEIIVQEIALTNFEKQRLIADARKGWISPDSAKALTNGKIKPASLINWIDSVKWISRDTTIFNYKDSVIASYPVYEADSTFTAEKTDSAQNASAKVVMTLKQRFLPLQEMFASEFQIDTLLFNWKQPGKSFFDHIKYGPGISIDVDGKIKPTVSIIYSF